MKNLTIVIPTVKYSIYLDLAIESVLKLSKEFNILVWVNNNDLKDFERSKYYNHNETRWECLESETINMIDSINNAISHVNRGWIFILSDDDLIKEGFLKNIELNKLNVFDLYATRINQIDEAGKVISENPEYEKELYSHDEAVDLYFQNKFHNHLSLFVFHKKMFEKVGGFVFCGYPNGYYLDTVFHGKVVANCTKLYCENEVVFSRRISMNQGSSKFYFENINNYFNIIIDNFYEDSAFRNEAEKRFTKEGYRKLLMKRRFYSVWNKINNLYRAPLKLRVKFIYSYLRDWDLDKSFKVFSIMSLLFISIRSLIPEKLKTAMKKKYFHQSTAVDENI